MYTVKKVIDFPTPAGMSLTNTKLFPAIECLVSDIPAWDGKFSEPFLQCRKRWVRKRSKECTEESEKLHNNIKNEQINHCGVNKEK